MPDEWVETLTPEERGALRWALRRGLVAAQQMTGELDPDDAGDAAADAFWRRRQAILEAWLAASDAASRRAREDEGGEAECPPKSGSG